jgi:ribosomal protein S18 acetylase RimI-like enzyme
MTPNFREAETGDLPALLELEQAVIQAERPYNEMIKSQGAVYYDIPALIADSNTCLLLAEQAGQIVATGYIQLRASKPSRVHARHGYIGFMFVDPKLRGQGVNRQIMDRLLAWGADRDVSTFSLDVYAQNESAIRAYEKAGFKPSMLEMQLSR